MPNATTEAAPRPIQRLDYRPPAFLVDRVDLSFELADEGTLVRSRLAMRRDPAAPPASELWLDGVDLDLVLLELNGRQLGPDDFRLEPTGIALAPPAAGPITLNIETRIHPGRNKLLEGLYRSGPAFCTQCEAEGFRRITYYPDRPDVLARFTTTIIADKASCPVLLSNGNQTAAGDLGDGRHFARWEDPHPKPAYLFALVAGDLTALEDGFTTRSGRQVRLRIFAPAADIDKCGHAMESLQRAMAWDERVYGLEYDLDDYMIVAVPDFNMGAMENKGLNIFNTRYVLARPETATDQDFAAVEAVIAHEYFHNWTGNRITCRDWFQLSLKEGLTVFRDQQFSADMGSAAVKRIGDVRALRAGQFPEDASPMAHPVRPDAYITIDNFYTATVYQKGAEVVRMLHTLLGADGFRRGMDLYVARHDGQAVTCDDFLAAMGDATGVDLGQFASWYAQAGTPELAIETRWRDEAGVLEARVTQNTPPTPGQPTKPPLHIPFAVGLVDADGADLPVVLDGENADRPAGTRVIGLTRAETTLRFAGLARPPVASWLRGFSAPVKLTTPRPPEELAFLAAHDGDPFARWEAFQALATRRLLAPDAATAPVAADLVDAFRRTLDDRRLDDAFVALALTLPGEAVLAEATDPIAVDAVHAARRHARADLGRQLADAWQARAEATPNGSYRFDGDAAGKRALANLALAYLVAGGVAGASEAAAARQAGATNMTDELAAFVMRVDLGGDAAADAIDRFERRWRDDALVMDKWFSVQAGAPHADTLDRVRRLMGHPAFDRANPNKVRALIGGFAIGNQARFHDPSGEGYAFLVDQVLELDRDNPRIAARLIGALGRWRRHDPDRGRLMRGELERALAAPGLSRDVFEIVSKSLEG
jgi:aminopeptidase N